MEISTSSNEAILIDQSTCKYEYETDLNCYNTSASSSFSIVKSEASEGNNNRYLIECSDLFSLVGFDGGDEEGEGGEGGEGGGGGGGVEFHFSLISAQTARASVQLEMSFWYSLDGVLGLNSICSPLFFSFLLFLLFLFLSLFYFLLVYLILFIIVIIYIFYLQVFIYKKIILIIIKIRKEITKKIQINKNFNFNFNYNFNKQIKKG